MRTLFQVHPINLSVAVWVGFLALFGIADDDGVVMTTYLEQSFRKAHITNAEAAREATVVAGMRRIRPCLMTTADNHAFTGSGAHINRVAART